MYRSTLDATRDTQAGLAGPLVVARPGALNSEGKPSDVDRELYLMLQVSVGVGGVGADTLVASGGGGTTSNAGGGYKFEDSHLRCVWEGARWG